MEIRSRNGFGESRETIVKFKLDFFFLSRRNIQCIFKLVYGVGLRALRKLFMQIHPSWSNKPSDAAALNKGKIHLGREEDVSFKKGNIDEWDFSLMTSVLLYTTRCALEISKRPGYDIALRELKKCRNKLLGHPSTDRMSDGDFNYYWPLLSSNFTVLGADPDDIAHLKLKSGILVIICSWAVKDICLLLHQLKGSIVLL